MSQDTLRYYERIGLILPVHRGPNGIRDYNELDIRRVEFIKCICGAGLPIEALIEYVDLVERGDSTIMAHKVILVEQCDLLVSRISELQKTLDMLNHKIQVYDEQILTKEKTIIQDE